MSESINPESFFKVSDKTAILSPQNTNRRFHVVDITGIGPVRFRSLTDKEWTRIQSTAMKKEGTIDKVHAQLINARLLVETIVDHEGNTILSESDIPALRDLDAGIMARLGTACRKHVGVEDEEAVKNE